MWWETFGKLEGRLWHSANQKGHIMNGTRAKLSTKAAANLFCFRRRKRWVAISYLLGYALSRRTFQFVFMASLCQQRKRILFPVPAHSQINCSSLTEGYHTFILQNPFSGSKGGSTTVSSLHIKMHPLIIAGWLEHGHFRNP